MARDLREIIDQIAPFVSPGSSHAVQLEKIKKDVGYTAPEFMYHRWNLLQAVLLETFPLPVTEDTAINVWAIFTGRSFDEMKKAIEEEQQGNQQ